MLGDPLEKRSRVAPAELGERGQQPQSHREDVCGFHGAGADEVHQRVALDVPDALKQFGNVARESSLFGEFMAATGLADAFRGACPATFRAEYLPAGATPHCIDFILTAREVTAESAALVFAEKKEPLGYVSDHIGLRARLSLTASTPGRGRFARP